MGGSDLLLLFTSGVEQESLEDVIASDSAAIHLGHKNKRWIATATSRVASQ
jgi:hypothetical protein